MTRTSLATTSLLALVLSACGTPERAEPEAGVVRVEPEVAPAPEEPAPEEVDPNTPAPEEVDTNTPPPGPTPPPPNDDPSQLPAVAVLDDVPPCPPVTVAEDASEAQRALVPLAEALRAVACTPAVFAQTTAVARETLELPADWTLTLTRRTASFDVGDEPIRVADLVAVLGEPEAERRLGLGRVPDWTVRLSPWGAGVVVISMAKAPGDDAPAGALAPIPADALVAGSIRVVLPAEALVFADDRPASTILASALTELASDPDRLESELPALAEALGLGERYELARYSEGSGETERVGLIVRPRRTELVAADLAAALELATPAFERLDLRDANPNRLTSGGEERIAWRGLQLEIELDAREGKHLALHAWTLADLLVLPAP